MSDLAVPLGGDTQDPIGVHFEGHLDLWHTADGFRDPRQLKCAQQVVTW